MARLDGEKTRGSRSSNERNRAIVSAAPTSGATFRALYEAHGHDLAFTYEMAAKSGVVRSVVKYHVKNGTLKCIAPGLFRFSELGYPEPIEVLRIVSMPLGKTAIASHTTALFVHNCTDLRLREFDFLVPRAKRFIQRKGIRIHTTTTALSEDDVETVDGLRVTTLSRSIVDAAHTIEDVYQLEVAIRRGLEWGRLKPEDLFARQKIAGKQWHWVEAALFNVMLTP